jgi:hypothetical protein
LEYKYLLEVFIDEPKPKKKMYTSFKGGVGAVLALGSRKDRANGDF